MREMSRSHYIHLYLCTRIINIADHIKFTFIAHSLKITILTQQS